MHVDLKEDLPSSTVSPAFQAAFVLSFFPDENVAGSELISFLRGEPSLDERYNLKADGFKDDMRVGRVS